MCIHIIANKILLHYYITLHFIICCYMRIWGGGYKPRESPPLDLFDPQLLFSQYLSSLSRPGMFLSTAIGDSSTRSARRGSLTSRSVLAPLALSYL